jgi:hypothetical protein
MRIHRPSFILSRHAYAFVYGTCGVVHGSIATENSSHTELFSRAPCYILLCTTYMTINH